MAVEQAGATRGAPRPASRDVLRRASVGLLAAVRGTSPTVQAFVASRLLVLLAGIGGVLAVAKRTSPLEVAAYQHQLGPVGYVLAGSVDRFDSAFYLDIASHGYGSLASGRVAFFPLYPLLIRAVGLLTGSLVIAGVLISAVAFLLALVLLHRLTELELGRRAATATVLIVCFAPLSLFFTAIYTESLFLMLSVGALLAARRERWALAGVLGALATLTRPTGFLLALALVVMRLRSSRRFDRRLAWALVPAVTLVAYLVALVADGFPWLAPFHVETIWHRIAVGPVGGLLAGVGEALRGAGSIITGGEPIYHPTLFGPFSAGAESIILLGVLVLAIVALVATFRTLPLQYGCLAAASLAMCLWSPQQGQPLNSFDRYTLTIFPLWMVAGAWIAKRRLERQAVLVGAILLVFYTVQFSSWAFVA